MAYKERQVEDLIKRIDTNELAEMLVSAAMEYFEECPEDLCVQHVGSDYIVFGGSNRLIWRPITGFKPDKAYCSRRFLDHFEEVNGG